MGGGLCLQKSNTARGKKQEEKQTSIQASLISISRSETSKTGQTRGPVSHLGAPARLRPLTTPADGGQTRRVHGDSVTASEQRDEPPPPPPPPLKRRHRPTSRTALPHGLEVAGSGAGLICIEGATEAQIFMLSSNTTAI